MKSIRTGTCKNVRTIEVPTTSPGVVRALIHADLRDIPVARRPLLSAMYAEMLLSGTSTMSKKVLNERIDAIGAAINVSASTETLILKMTTTIEKFDETLKIMDAIIRSSDFKNSELSLAKKKALQDLHDEKDNAKTRAYIDFTRMLYPLRHPYRAASTLERIKDLKTISRKELVLLHAHVRKAPWTIGVSATPLCSKKTLVGLSRLNVGNSTPHEHEFRNAPAVPPGTSFGTVPGKVNIEVCLGNTIPLFVNDRAYLALSLGIDILGKHGGFVGRLMSTVREKEGLTYGIYASLQGGTLDTTGHWQIRTFFTAKDYRQGIASTMREIKKIRDSGVTELEIARMKEIVANQFRMAHGSSSGLLGLYLSAYSGGITPEDIEKRMEAIASLTKTEIDDALRTYIDVDNIVLTAAGPIDSKGTPLEKAPSRGTIQS